MAAARASAGAAWSCTSAAAAASPTACRAPITRATAQEIDWILRRLRARNAGGPLYAVGVSLGGNALLKWLGEQREDAAGVIDAAAAVSAPLDLMAAGDALGSGFNRIYTRNFLRTLQAKSLAKLERFPGLLDADAVRAAAHAARVRRRRHRAAARLPRHRRLLDARERQAAGSKRIRVPTLVLNARNDPFLPARRAAAGAQTSSDVVTLEQPDEGGHVGFVGGPFPGRLRLAAAAHPAFLRASRMR